MYSVSDIYKELSEAPIREYHLIFTCYHLVNGAYEKYAEYNTDDQPIISAKIVNGQTTGGFTLGSTICASLTMTVAKSMPIKTNDRINVFVLFETPYAHTASSETLSLGEFYVDSVQVGTQNTQIIALDKMARLAKDYNSTLTYPSTISKMFVELAMQANAPVSPDVNVFNDANVPVKPVKGQDSGGNDVYFTRREVLGYIAGINGGNAYIDKNGEINISIPKETGVTIDYSNVISQTLNDTSLEIKDININTGGTSQSTKDDLDDSTVELYYPISFDTSMLDTLKELVKALIGLKYDSVVLKKQGTGIFEPGDMVSYKAADNKVYKMLIMGIIYDFSGGFFSETLYSLAKSEAQKQYAGVENISQNIASSGTNGVTNEQNYLIEYEYLTDTSVKYNGKTYTVTIDQETGLISKITDDQEGEFKPTINSGITDTTLHNAVFWAIAMLSKLGKPEPEPIPDYFDVLWDFYQNMPNKPPAAIIIAYQDTQSGFLVTMSNARTLFDLYLHWSRDNLKRGQLGIDIVIYYYKATAYLYQGEYPNEPVSDSKLKSVILGYRPENETRHAYFSISPDEIHPALLTKIIVGTDYMFTLGDIKFKDIFSVNMKEITAAWFFGFVERSGGLVSYFYYVIYYRNGYIPKIDVANSEIINGSDGGFDRIVEYIHSGTVISTSDILTDVIPLNLNSLSKFSDWVSKEQTAILLENLEQNVYFNTFDICDENGNVLLPKNCDIDFFV